MPGKGLIVGVEAKAAPGGVASRELEEFHRMVWRPADLWLAPAPTGSGIGDGKRLWSAPVQPRFLRGMSGLWSWLRVQPCAGGGGAGFQLLNYRLSPVLSG